MKKPMAGLSKGGDGQATAFQQWLGKVVESCDASRLKVDT